MERQAALVPRAGGSQHRNDLDGLPAASGTPQTFQEPNLLEQFTLEIKRRTLVVRSFPDEASCLRLMLAVAAEQHEAWMEGSRFLNPDLLREQIKPIKTTMATAD